MVGIGDVVVYVDPVRVEHKALVTAVWGNEEPCSVNLVCVSPDEGETDNYGRQIRRDTSVMPEALQAAPGRFWRHVA